MNSVRFGPLRYNLQQVIERGREKKRGAEREKRNNPVAHSYSETIPSVALALWMQREEERNAVKFSVE